MSLITPNTRSRGPTKFNGRRNENNRIYANPLPIIFAEPPSSRTRSVLGLLGLSLTQVVNPHCEGTFDAASRSVWIVERKDSMILWQRGFFGKGDLSRSEPSWLARQTNNRQKGGTSACLYSLCRALADHPGVELTSEEIREKRRAERKQFKLDRAAAIAANAAEAEAIFEAEGRVIVPALSGPGIPSSATWRPTPSVQEPPKTPLGEELEAEEPFEDEEPLEDVEHLQLTLPEAFFLLWNLDCLTVLDPHTVHIIQHVTLVTVDAENGSSSSANQ